MSSSESSSDSDSDYEIKSSYTPNELQHEMDIFTKRVNLAAIYISLKKKKGTSKYITHTNYINTYI